MGKLCQIKGVCREPREPLKPVTTNGKKNLLDSLKIGQNLTGKQRIEHRNLLAKFSNVFYTGGPLPLVDVGVEHTVRVKEPATPIAVALEGWTRYQSRKSRGNLRSYSKCGLFDNLAAHGPHL